jgi:Fic family protein
MGRGRLTTLLLLRAGYSYVPFSSMERIIEANKEQYYLALRRAQGTLAKGSKLPEWVTFFLKTMVKQKQELEKKLKREGLLEKLPEVSAQILAYVRDQGRATIGDIVTVTKQNRNTVKAHLRSLVETGKLIQRGKGKGTWYKGI